MSTISFPPTLILDIGAAEFDSTTNHYEPLLDRPESKLLGIEPNPTEYNRLLTRHVGDHSRSYLNLLLGDGRPHTFRLCRHPGKSSLLEPNTSLSRQYGNDPDDLVVVSEKAHETVRLDDVAEARGAHLVKLDTQGSELTILNEGLTTLAGALAVECEVEFVEQYFGQPLFSEVELFMRSQGFQFVKFLGYGTRLLKPLSSSANAGTQWLWSDALFLKRLDLWPTLSDEDLLRIHHIMHLAYKSIDFAYTALSIVDARHSTNCAKSYIEAYRA